MSVFKNSNSEHNQPNETLTATRSQLELAFSKWLKAFETAPNDFLPQPDSTTYGADCAEYLIQLLKED